MVKTSGTVSIAILEQSGVTPTRVARNRAWACSELGIGYARLSWNPNAWVDDELATLRVANVTHGEGRSILAEWAIGKGFDYLVFVDDDLVILPHKESSVVNFAMRLAKSFGRSTAVAVASRRVTLSGLERLKLLLTSISPLTGTVFSPTDWAHRWSTPQHRIEMGRASFPIAFHDLQCQIFSRAAARLCFPTPLSGAGGATWWVQLLGSEEWPERQVCLGGLSAYNTRSDPHQNHSVDGFLDTAELLDSMRTFVRRQEVWDRYFGSGAVAKDRAQRNRETHEQVRVDSSPLSASKAEIFIRERADRLYEIEAIRRQQSLVRDELNAKIGVID